MYLRGDRVSLKRRLSDRAKVVLRSTLALPLKHAKDILEGVRLGRSFQIFVHYLDCLTLRTYLTFEYVSVSFVAV